MVAQATQRALPTPSLISNVSLANGAGDATSKNSLQLDLGSMKELKRRTSSTQVIMSLNDGELPPLKEGQITIFTPSGVTPTVTIEPSPRSLRSSSPKWGKKVRNPSQWKGGMVGDRRSGSTSPVPPSDLAHPEHFHFDDSLRRNSEEHSTLHAPLGDANKFTAAFFALGPSSPAHDHAAGTGATSGGGLSPRSAWSQPVSPDPEARMLSMIMAMQHSHALLAARVDELEERLAQEVAQRTALELKLLSLGAK